MAVIVSLAFHVPQAEEIEKEAAISEQDKPKLNFKKTKIKSKRK
jgi:hypothetical protein